MKQAVLVVNCYPKEKSEYAWLNFVRSVSKRIKSRPSQSIIPVFNMGDYATKEKIEIGNHCVLNVPVSLLLKSGLNYILERYKNEYDFIGYLIFDTLASTSEATLDKLEYATITNMMRHYGLNFYSFTNVVDFLVYGYIKKTINNGYGIITSEKENDYMQNDITNTVRAYGDWINIGKSSHTIKNVIFNNPATIVFWEDGTKTVVKCSDGDIFDPEKGIAMAFMKKILGNKGRYYDEIKKWVPMEDEEVKWKADLVKRANESKARLVEQLKKELSKIDIPDWAYDESVMETNKYGEPYDTRLFYSGKQKIVCAGDCYHVRNMKKKNMIAYYTLGDALYNGCRPCKHCHGVHKKEA